MTSKEPQLRKKLLYRAIHRGCKETDIIIGKFAESEIEHLNSAQLQDLEKLLEIDDGTIYNWATEKVEIDAEFDTSLWKNIKTFWQQKHGQE
ncbi:MAG: succinate dehydrogenase assembly factor 2 [Alphaproteobacteria bacterium]|jgi:antitoxin CptB